LTWSSIAGWVGVKSGKQNTGYFERRLFFPVDGSFFDDSLCTPYINRLFFVALQNKDFRVHL